MWLGLGKRVSDWKRITEEKDSRNDLILQSAKEQNRNSSNFRHHNLTPPVLVAERCQPLGHRNCAGDHLGDAQESVFKHQTLDIARLLVLGNQIDRDSTANTLPENNNLVVLQVVARADVVEPCLSIDHEALLVGRSGGESVAAVLEHQHRAVDVVGQDAAYGQAVADIACISVEEQDGDGAGLGFVGGSQEEGTQSLAVRGWD